MELFSNIGDFNNKDLQNSVVKIWELVKNSVEKIDTLTQKNQELLARNSFYDKANSDKDAQIKALTDKLVELESEINNISASNNNYNEEINQLNLKLEGLNDFDKLKQDYENLTQKYDILKEKTAFITSLSQELTTEKQKVSELEFNNRGLEKKLNEFLEMKENLEFAQKEVARKNIMIHTNTQDLETLTNSLAIAESEIFRLKNIENQFKVISANYNSLKNSVDSENIAKNDELNNLQSENNELNHKYKTLLESIENLKGLLSQKEFQIEEFENRIYKYELDEAEYATKFDFYEKELASKIQEYSELRETINSLSSQVNELNGYRELVFYKEKQIEDLQVEHKRLNAMVTSLDLQLNKAREENKSSEFDATKFMIEKDELNNKIIVLNKKIDEKSLELIDLMNDYDKINQELTKKNDDFKELKEYNETLELDNLDLNDKIANLMTSTIEYEATIESLLKDIDSMREECNTANKKYEELSYKYDDMAISYESLKGVNSEIENLRLALDESYYKNSLLEKENENIKSNDSIFEATKIEYQNQINNLSSLNDEILRANNLLKEENRDLSQKFTEMLLAKTSQTKELDDLKELTTTQNVKITHLRNEIEKAEILISELSAKIDEEKEYDSFNDAKLESYNVEINDLKDSLNLANDKINEYESKIDEFKSIIQRLSESVISKENLINSLNENLENLSLDYNKLRTDFELQKQNQQQINLQEETIFNLSSLNEKLNNVQSDLESSNKLNLSKIKELEDLISEKDNEINALKNHITDSNNNDELTEKLKVLTEVNNKQVEKIQQLDNMLIEINTENSELKNKLSDSKLTDDLNTRIKDLEISNELNIAKIKDLEMLLKLKNEELNALIQISPQADINTLDEEGKKILLSKIDSYIEKLNNIIGKM